MSRIFWLVAILFIMIKTTEGQSDFRLKADGLSAEGSYSEAIKNYKIAIHQGHASLGTYYNLGNAYLNVDSIALAILYLEKAHKIDPRQTDVLNNLNIARGRVEDQLIEIPEFFIIDYWEKFCHLYQANTWAFLSILFFILIGLLTYYTLYKGAKLSRKNQVFSYLLLSVFTTVSFFAGIHRKNDFIKIDEAIIMIKSTLNSGPDNRSNEVKILYPGYKLYIEDTLEGWYKVSTIDREVGWVRPEWVRII